MSIGAAADRLGKGTGWDHEERSWTHSESDSTCLTRYEPSLVLCQSVPS